MWQKVAKFKGAEYFRKALYAARQSVQQVQQALQGDLENIRKWVCQNKLVLNTKKTKVMLVCSTRKRPKQHGIKLSMGGVQTFGSAARQLLIMVVSISLYIKTACIIRRIAKYLPGKILRQITQALIESQVNYCSVVWGNASSSEVRRLQNAQNKAARIVLCGDVVLLLSSYAMFLVINQQDN